MRDNVRANLLERIGKGRLWLDQLRTGEASGTEQIASREGCSERSVRQILNLAFLSPEVIRAIIDGRLPRGTGVAQLADLPIEWERQHQAIGITAVSKEA